MTSPNNTAVPWTQKILGSKLAEVWAFAAILGGGRYQCLSTSEHWTSHYSSDFDGVVLLEWI